MDCNLLHYFVTAQLQKHPQDFVHANLLNGFQFTASQAGMLLVLFDCMLHAHFTHTTHKPERPVHAFQHL